jgi:hypothetical protein
MLEVVALSVLLTTAHPIGTSSDGILKPVLGLLCFKTGEQVSGLNKICYYSCPAGGAAVTIKSYELCPISITR